jgi:hypothetical protein
MLTTHLTISFVKKVIQFCVGKYTLFFYNMFPNNMSQNCNDVTPHPSGLRSDPIRPLNPF